jgi:hypothetical protein
MAETVKHIGGLIQRKDEIKRVDDKQSPQNALKSGAPAEPAPGTRLRFANGLAQAQRASACSEQMPQKRKTKYLR